MKQHLDTAPVWAAYRVDCECAFCHLEQDAEQGYLDAFLGGSVMEPAVRIEVNQKGFCAAHLRQLYHARNRLGLALMAHTHLKQQLAALAPPARASLFNRQRTTPPAAPSTCILCDRLNATMTRYAETLVHMWRHEPEFQRAFAASKGPCLRHYALLQTAGSGDAAFLDALYQLARANLERVEKDLEWFTLKFDYRNQDKPWGDSRDAVERALNKLRGRVIDPAPDP